uniref:Uncharacterized protein n=1 Tax=Oryctolagus cuniculus TaxID=9986 RepID=A0A5F9CCU7_RABIT
MFPHLAPPKGFGFNSLRARRSISRDQPSTIVIALNQNLQFFKNNLMTPNALWSILEYEPKGPLA